MNFFGPRRAGNTMHSNRILSMAIPMIIVGFFSYLARNYQFDDALIYLRYIKNFQAGFGLTFNPGEKFNGLTSPFFTYVILIGSLVFAKLQTATIVLSALFLFGAAIFGGKIFSRGNAEAIFSASVIGSFGYFYSTFGMETPLFLLLIGLSLYLYKIESEYFVITLALLVITRSEGIFLAAPMAAAYLFKNKKLPAINLLLIAVIIFSLPFIFNYFYYGDFLPATGNAKIGQGKSGLWGEKWIFLDVKYLFNGFFSGSYFAALLFICFSLYGMVNLLKEKAVASTIIIIFSLLLLGFYAGLNIPNYHWYYAPFFYFMLIFASHGFWRCSVKLLSNGVLNFRGIIFLLICIGSFLALGKVVSFAERGRVESYVNIGKWLKDNTPPNASIAMVEIGTIGWYADRKIIDILGLVNKYNADYIAERNFSGWLYHYQPDYILRHDPIWPHEQSIDALQQNGVYIPVDKFDFPGYAILKKSGKYSDSAIVDFAKEQTKKQAIFDQMIKTSPIGAPSVMKDGSVLFAHAPSTVSLVVKNIPKSIQVSYGIKEAAAGKHSGVCFEIIQDNGNKTILHSCIDSSASKSELSRRETIHVSGKPEEKLIFKTICSGSCDYAWSYWSGIDLK